MKTKIVLIVTLFFAASAMSLPMTCSCTSGSMTVEVSGGTTTMSCSGGGRVSCKIK